MFTVVYAVKELDWQTDKDSLINGINGVLMIETREQLQTMVTELDRKFSQIGLNMCLKKTKVIRSRKLGQAIKVREQERVIFMWNISKVGKRESTGRNLS